MSYEKTEQKKDMRKEGEDELLYRRYAFWS